MASWSISENSGGHLYSANAQIINNSNATWSVILQATTGGNAALSNASQNQHVLTGFFWKGSAGAYTKVGAVAAPGSGIFNDNGSSASGTLAEHWGYKNSLGFGSFNHGIAASGLGGLFGGSSAFSGNSSLQGVDWGLVSDFVPGGIGGNQNPFVRNTAIFTFGGQVTTGQFNDVWFQYGSDTDEPGFGPPPSSLVPETDGIYQLLAAGLPLIGFAIACRRKIALS